MCIAVDVQTGLLCWDGLSSAGGSVTLPYACTIELKAQIAGRTA